VNSAEIDSIYSKENEESSTSTDWVTPMIDFLKGNHDLLHQMVSGFLQGELKCYLHLKGDGQFDSLIQLGQLTPSLFAQIFRVAYLNFISDEEIINEDKKASLDWMQEKHPEILRDCQAESAEMDARCRRILKPDEVKSIFMILLKPDDKGSESQ
jgi:hypothetical protein